MKDLVSGMIYLEPPTSWGWCAHRLFFHLLLFLFFPFHCFWVFNASVCALQVSNIEQCLVRCNRFVQNTKWYYAQNITMYCVHSGVFKTKGKSWDFSINAYCKTVSNVCLVSHSELLVLIRRKLRRWVIKWACLLCAWESWGMICGIMQLLYYSITRQLRSSSSVITSLCGILENCLL